MGVGLKYLDRHWLLPAGRYVVGRSPDSELFINDGSVSRRHALITVRDDRVFVEDLQSRNGVYVNERKITGAREVGDGDEIGIGRHRMTVVIERAGAWSPEYSKETTPLDRRDVISMLPRFGDPPSSASAAEEDRSDETARFATVGHAAPEATDPQLSSVPPADAERSDDRFNTLQLVAAVADKALARGQPKVAEESLHVVLDEIREAARKREPISPATADTAARYALRLASALRAGRWIDYVFDLYLSLDRSMPGREGDLLNEAAHKVRTIDVSLLERYQRQVERLGGPVSGAERDAYEWLSLKFKG